ncbi:MAG: 3-dehydroquinate synthase [Acidimicrobiia bacterium]|nr:3-dehydroquinate synthase [Acidimicrobiia bacterium]
MHRVTVAVDPPYDVCIGPGSLSEINALLADRPRAHLVTQQRVLDACHDALRPILEARAMPISLIDDGENAKTLASVERLCRDFAAHGLLRADVVIAVGGGVVGDTAGFAAAVYHRGVAVVQVPTTLLAQVDAAIGGKTAVNIPEGKNLVGAFHQPIGVVADTATLATLPEVELRCGLGEVVKYALMPEGSTVGAILDRDSDRILGRDPEVLSELVGACAAIKAKVVAADPEERSGLRAALNYGHTLAHALETVSGHALAHGEAVAVGLVFATYLAHGLERVGPEVPEHAASLLTRLGLPITVPAGASGDDLVAVMRRDKKAKGGLTFVLPGPNGLEQVDDPPMPAIERALSAVGVRT